MEHYITQFIKDLHQVTSAMKPPLGPWEEFEDNENNEPKSDGEANDDNDWEKKILISEATGIDTTLLPPEEKLSIEQQALLAFELEDFLKYYKIYLNFPFVFPAHLRYSFIRNLWKEDYEVDIVGKTHIEFCDYSGDNCPFPRYCSICDDYERMKASNGRLQDRMDVKNDIFSFDEKEDNYPFMEEFNGFYDDNGDKIDINTIPVPPLCTICKSYHIDDWDENLLCLMNRNDQRNKKEFICGAFMKG